MNLVKDQLHHVNQVGTITGLDYWTQPNCKIHLVLCRTEAKCTYLFTSIPLLPTMPFLEFAEVKGRMHI